MASQSIESHRAGAAVLTGDTACRKKSVGLLEELGLPKSLLPMEAMHPGGKKKVEHTFKKIQQTVSYAAKVTAFAEKGKLKKITGVKTKEMMLWLSVVEVYVRRLGRRRYIRLQVPSLREERPSLLRKRAKPD
ncbi:uncharacterized protein [Miscanthus floridulus]|uniref:uncharacterized protein n=1 Tax=Miscanthus floridulus TaxID=154761 RepID=UPI003457BE45